MYKILLSLFSFIILNSICVKPKIHNNDNFKKEKYEVINLVIERISNHKDNYPLLLYSKLGGINFSNNLSCRDENKISKFVNDSLHLKTKPNEFRYINNVENINPKFLNSKYKVKIIEKNDSSNKDFVHISNPKFFNHNKNCFISYEYGDYEFGNLILSKENEKWIVRFVICESSISY